MPGAQGRFRSHQITSARTKGSPTPRFKVPVSSTSSVEVASRTSGGRFASSAGSTGCPSRSEDVGSDSAGGQCAGGRPDASAGRAANFSDAAPLPLRLMLPIIRSVSLLILAFSSLTSFRLLFLTPETSGRGCMHTAHAVTVQTGSARLNSDTIGITSSCPLEAGSEAYQLLKQSAKLGPTVRGRRRAAS